MLNYTTQTRNFIDWQELEEFLKEIYGAEYSFVSATECSNDSSTEYTVSSSAPAEYDQIIWQEVLNGESPYCSAHVVLDKLCVDGHLPPGLYTVRVSW